MKTQKEYIEYLINQVEDLVLKKSLNKSQGNILISKLNKSIEQLHINNQTSAINKLRAFIRKATSFMHARILSQEELQPLIDTANSILEQL